MTFQHELKKNYWLGLVRDEMPEMSHAEMQSEHYRIVRNPQTVNDSLYIQDGMMDCRMEDELLPAMRAMIPRQPPPVNKTVTHITFDKKTFELEARLSEMERQYKYLVSNVSFKKNRYKYDG